MAKIDLKKGFQKIEESAKSAVNAVKEVDIREVAKNVQTEIENFDPKEAKDKAIDAVKSAGPTIQKHMEETKESRKIAKNVLKKEVVFNEKLMIIDALKILRIMMCVDRVVEESEISSFKELAKELDPDETCDIESLCTICDEIIKKADENNGIEYLKNSVDDAVKHSRFFCKGTIDKRHLLWNLLAVAYSDECYSDAEKELLHAIAQCFNLSSDLVQELEVAYLTVSSIIRDEDNLKKSGRTFDEVNSRLEELQKRKDNIMQGVYALIND